MAAASATAAATNADVRIRRIIISSALGGLISRSDLRLKIGRCQSCRAGLAGNAARHYRLARQLVPEQPDSLGSDGQTSDAAWVAQGLATQLLNRSEERRVVEWGSNRG